LPQASCNLTGLLEQTVCRRYTTYAMWQCAVDTLHMLYGRAIPGIWATL